MTRTTTWLWGICLLFSWGGGASAAGSFPPHSGQSPWSFATIEDPSSTYVVNDTDSETIDRYMGRSDGSIIIDVTIRRYVGPTDNKGHLEGAEELIQRGIIGKNATIRIPAFDVDEHTFPVIDCDEDGFLDQLKNEVDKVYLNDEEIGVLRGNDDIWLPQTFEVPITKLKFPGKPGEIAVNRFEIEIDTANRDVVLSSGAVGCDTWAVSIDWIGVKFQASSPVVMVHGISPFGDPSKAFENFERGLKNERVEATDSSIVLVDPGMPPDQLPAGCPNIPYYNTFASNIDQLREQVPKIAKRFGSETLHFVTHSKGGLDTRGFLWSMMRSPIQVPVGKMGGTDVKRDLEARSLITLNTPHDGSVLAKYLVEARQLTWIQALETLNPNVYLAYFFEQWKKAPYACDLTSTRSANLVASTTLPNGLQAASVATDADRDGNQQIDAAEAQEFPVTFIANHLYQLLGEVANVTITVEPVPWGPARITVKEEPTTLFETNDAIVTQRSAGLYYTLHSINGWNHLSVRSEENAQDIAVEAQGGGLIDWRVR